VPEAARSAPLRIVVAGAGAVGSVFGGLLQAAGHDVQLVGRDPHMREIARAGLAVTGLFGDAWVFPRVATDLATADAPADVVLVTVKSHATTQVASTLAAWRHRAPLVVSLQNGLGNVETLIRVLGAGRVLGARVIFGAVLPRVGAAHVTVNAQPVAVGPLAPDPTLEVAAQRLVALFLAAGLPSETVAAIEPVLWEKALYNCGLNPLGALHGLTYGEVAAAPALRMELDAAMDEGFCVAKAKGIALPYRDAGAYRAHFYARLLPPTAAHRSSMRQDLEAGRPTEVDAIGGEIVRTGKRLGIPTPVNERLVAAVHAAERRTVPGERLT
jgi:2-dehydropantoate 2-reductase